eukprot:COSAG02_NODE_16339_length_1091_cov_1.500000_2_plen_47_part_01
MIRNLRIIVVAKYAGRRTYWYRAEPWPCVRRHIGHTVPFEPNRPAHM